MRISDWSSDVCSSDLAPRAQRLAVLAAADHHARRASLLYQYLLDQRAGPHREIAMFAQRLDIGARRRPAFAALLRHLIKAEAFIVGAVEIGGARQVPRRRALDEAPAPDRTSGVWGKRVP